MALDAARPRVVLAAVALAGVVTAACAGSAPLGAVTPAEGRAPWMAGSLADAADAAPERGAREALETALFARVLADRAAHGLPPLAPDGRLRERARARAAAQLGTAALSHDDAAGPLAFRRLLREEGVSFSLAAENLARPRAQQGASAAHLAAEAERALMASAAHRENILEPRFDRVAVGVARGADGRVVFAQIFRAP